MSAGPPGASRRRRHLDCPLSSFLLLFCLLLALAHHPASGLTCSLQNSDVVILGLDPDTLEYYLLNSTYDDPRSNESHQHFRDLAGGMLRGRGFGDQGEAGVDDPERRAAYAVAGVNESSGVDRRAPLETLQVRRCWCARSHYYPENRYYCETKKSYCFIQRSFVYTGSLPTPMCVNVYRKTTITKTIWPIVVVTYAILFIMLLCTPPGRNAMDCVLSHTCCYWCWNDIVLKIMERRNPERVRTLIRRFYWRNRERIEQRYQEMVTGNNGNHDGTAQQGSTAPAVPVTELLLKTTIYRCSTVKESEGNVCDPSSPASTSPEQVNAAGSSSTSEAADEEGEDWMETNGAAAAVACTICFGPLEDGDRVGSLPCSHVFHVDCLKTWLSRRNVCPLCLRTDVATPNVNSTGTRSEGARASHGRGTGDETQEEEAGISRETEGTSSAAAEEPPVVAERRRNPDG